MARTDFPRDRRGQSTIIGFVLVFAIVILLLVTLQVAAVPTWNQGVEYEHNERLQDSLEQYRDGVYDRATQGRLSSESIELGTRYPTRPFLLNPGDPTGSIRTTAVGNVSIEGATATGEARDYWDGTERTFTTRHLVYRPNYNEYANAPTTVFENSVLYNRFGERSLPITPERLVRGNDISIVTLNGSLDRASSGTYDLEAVPLSGSDDVTTVRSDGDLTISVPTRLSESTWRDLLEAELTENGGRVTSLDVTEGEPYDTLRLRLTAGTYNLRMAEIGVGTRLDEPAAHYITSKTAQEVQVAPGATERLVFTVRDRYNNPVSGVEVNAAPSGLAGLSPVDPVTDSDGQAVFRYEGTDPGQATVTASFGDGLVPRQRANVTITTSSAGGESPLGVEWTGFGDTSNEDDRYPFDVEANGGDTATLTLTSEPAVEGLDVEYVVSNRTVGSLDSSTGTTDAGGQDTVTFTAKNDGVVTVYAIGAGDVDPMRITVVNTTHSSPVGDEDAPSIDSLTVTSENQTQGSQKYASFTVDYAVSGDVELREIQFTVTKIRDNTTIIENTTVLNETTASGTKLLRNPDQKPSPKGDYEVVVTVVDESGTETSETRLVTVS